jgi:hypothetical protein
MKVQLGEVGPGDYVAFDPTGRDLPDCAEIGRVNYLYSTSSSADGTRELEEDGPYANVTVNGSGEEIGRITEIFAVVWVNPRRCMFCGGGVTSSNPDISYCSGCFYSGRSQEEVFASTGIIDLLHDLPDAVPGSAGVWHTGGGCFCLGITFTDGSYAMMTVGGDASVDGNPDEPVWSGSFYADEDDDGAEFPLTPDWVNSPLGDVIAGIPAVREKAVSAKMEA